MSRRLFLIFFLNVFFNLLAQNHVPEWAKGVVWYQIFPERFANADTSNDPAKEKVFINKKTFPENWKNSRWTSNWFEKPDWASDSNFDDIYFRRYGGDIQGIINKLDYLKELGIGAIYLNPVFDAVSLHKYDASTYHHIDINFGPNPRMDEVVIGSENPVDSNTWQWTSADSIFLDLIRQVHLRNMKIIIDGVFNHTGVQFWAFQDIVRNGEMSEYKGWYRIKSFDDPQTENNEFDYKGWWGVKSLPEFNRNDNNLVEGPKQYIFSATKRWMDPNGDGNPEDGIDGWRLDVASEVPIGFWREWVSLVKSTNKQAVIIGELWKLSPNFVGQNGVFDGLMNYNFAFAVNDFFIAKKNPISVHDFIKQLREIDSTYPEDNLLVLQNLLDSHDTDRLASMIVNPDRNFDWDANAGNPDYNPGKPSEADYKLQKLIAAFQFTYPGSPMIYYGDEAGMWGADDPHCRKPMIWDDLQYDNEIVDSASGFKKGLGSCKVEFNNDIYDFYKKIISLRNDHPALKIGETEFVLADDEKNLLAFKRVSKSETILVFFNLSDKLTTSPIAAQNFHAADDLISGETIRLNGQAGIDLPANSFRIFLLR